MAAIKRNSLLFVLLKSLLLVLMLNGSTRASVWVSASAEYNVDPLHLYAIALQESRRLRPDGLVRPWPWTLRTDKYGAMYFHSFEEAASKLDHLINQEKIKNIDIGAMQINLLYNGHLLPDAKEILLPENNIRLGALILRRELNAQNQNLRLGIAYYHNPDQSKGLPYADAVLGILSKLQSIPGIEVALTL